MAGGILSFIRNIFAKDNNRGEDSARNRYNKYYSVNGPNIGLGSLYSSDQFQGAAGDPSAMQDDLLTRYADYEGLDDVPELSTALDIISDDATQSDHMTGQIVHIQAEDADVQKMLEDCFHKNLRIDENMWEIARTLCVAEGSRIWGGRCSKIEEIVVGDNNFGFKDWDIQRQKVTEFYNNGIRDVWKIKTKHRETLVTPDHPLMIVNDEGQIEWKTPQDFELIKYPSGRSFKTQPRLVIATKCLTNNIVPNFQDILSNCLNENNKGTPKGVNWPDDGDLKFCRLFGFLLGDGWITDNETNHSIQFSKKLKQAINDFYIGILKGFGLNPILNNKTYCTSSIYLVRLLKGLDWTNGSHEKKIPEWVFQLPDQYREEVLWGIMDADGWETSPKTNRENALHIELCNKEFLQDIKFLIDGLGYICGNIRHRRRIIKEICGKKLKEDEHDFYCITFRREKFARLFEVEKVIAIEPMGKMQVYDITVDNNEHNFIANGLTHHNCKYGNNYEEHIITPEDGLIDLNFLPPPQVRRIDDEDGSLLGFLYDRSGQFQISTDEFESRIKDRKLNLQRYYETGRQTNVLEDWEVTHFRFRSKQRGSQYGWSFLEAARFTTKRLLMLEDAAMLYKLSRAAQRFVFKIDVGDLPPNEALAYVDKVKGRIKKAKYINPKTGKFDLTNNPMSTDEDFFIPTRKDKAAMEIEDVGGFDGSFYMDDLDYFKNKMYSAIKIPKDYLNYSEDSVSKANLATEDMRFCRTVIRVQRELRTGLVNMARVHLAALGHDPDVLEFDVYLTPPSTIFEMAMMEVRQAQLDIAADYRSFVDDYWIMTNILKFSDDEVQEILKRKKQQEQGDNPFAEYRFPSVESKHPLSKRRMNKEVERVLSDIGEHVLLNDKGVVGKRLNELKELSKEIKEVLSKK